jgi:hypothetical protein
MPNAAVIYCRILTQEKEGATVNYHSIFIALVPRHNNIIFGGIIDQNNPRRVYSSLGTFNYLLQIISSPF